MFPASEEHQGEETHSHVLGFNNQVSICLLTVIIIKPLLRYKFRSEPLVAEWASWDTEEGGRKIHNGRAFHSPVCHVFKMSHVCRVTAELYLMICSAPEEVQTCGGPQMAPSGSSSYRKEPQISTQLHNLYTIRSPGRAAPTLWCIRLSIQLLARWGMRGNARIGFENGSADVEMWEYSCHNEGDSEWTQISPSEEEGVLVGSVQVCSSRCMISPKSTAPIHFSTQCQCNGYNRFLPVLDLWLSLCEGWTHVVFFRVDPDAHE